MAKKHKKTKKHKIPSPDISKLFNEWFEKFGLLISDLYDQIAPRKKNQKKTSKKKKPFSKNPAVWIALILITLFSFYKILQHKSELQYQTNYSELVKNAQRQALLQAAHDTEEHEMEGITEQETMAAKKLQISNSGWETSEYAKGQMLQQEAKSEKKNRKK